MPRTRASIEALALVVAVGCLAIGATGAFATAFDSCTDMVDVIIESYDPVTHTGVVQSGQIPACTGTCSDEHLNCQFGWEAPVETPPGSHIWVQNGECGCCYPQNGAFGGDGTQSTTKCREQISTTVGSGVKTIHCTGSCSSGTCHDTIVAVSQNPPSWKFNCGC
jgi:hypothetical protein